MDLDTVGYCELRAQVADLEKDLTELRSAVRALLELANRSKGGLWVGMAIVSMASAAVSWIVANLPWFK